MATRVDAAAAKQRQQKIILVVGAALLAIVVAIQAPKLMKHGKSAASATSASTSTSTDGTTPITTTPSSTTTTPNATGTLPSTVSTAHGPAAKVAGVVVRTAGSPTAKTGQLWSLSRFKPKDPFVQQVEDTTATAGSTSGSTASSAPSTAKAGGAKGAGAPTAIPSTGTGSIVTPTTVTPAALAYATLMVNGKPQQLTLRDVFPKSDPTFVLRSVGKGYIKVGVAGGKFVGGALIKLELGNAVTLMNTATGQRFVMKLVFTGSQPEHIATFNVPATSSTGATP